MEEYSKEVLDIINRLKGLMRREISCFEGRFCNKGTFEQILTRINDLFNLDVIHLEYTVSQDAAGTLIITAKNLYTLLLLQGICIPYEVVKDLTEFPTEFGTYAIKDGNPVFKPIKTIDYIDFSIYFDENGNVLKGDN